MQLNYISTRGFGDQRTNAVSKILPRLTTDAVCSALCWRGTQEKKSFEKLENLNSLLYKAIANKFPNYTVPQYERSVKNWLRHANERIKRKILSDN